MRQELVSGPLQRRTDGSKRQRLGSPSPRCLICGCLDLEALIAVPAAELPRPVLEQHHVAGRAASDLTLTLCRNCHAILTDWQEDWDRRLRHPVTHAERTGAFLQGLAQMLQLLARSLNEMAVWIHARIRELL